MISMSFLCFVIKPYLMISKQVVQFYCWRESETETTISEIQSSKVVLLSESQQQKIRTLKSMFSKDNHLVEKVFSGVSQRCFDWTKFDSAISECVKYASISYGGILKSLPYWKTQQSMFSVSYGENNLVV